MKDLKEKENRKRRKSMLWALFVIVLMAGSSIAYVFSSIGQDNTPKTDFEYHGFTFTKTDSGYYFLYQNKPIQVDYLPSEVANIPYQSMPLVSSKVYFAFNATERDVNLDYSMRKVYSVLRGKGTVTTIACTSEIDCPDIPIVYCDSSPSPVIVFRSGVSSRGYIEGQSISEVQAMVVTVPFPLRT